MVNEYIKFDKLKFIADEPLPGCAARIIQGLVETLNEYIEDDEMAEYTQDRGCYGTSADEVVRNKLRAKYAIFSYVSMEFKYKGDMQ